MCRAINSSARVICPLPHDTQDPIHYRHRARTGRGDKEVVIDRWEWPITENIGNLGKVKEAVTLKHGILTGISLSGEEIFSPIEVKSVRTSGVLPASRNCLLTRATLCCRSAERG